MKDTIIQLQTEALAAIAAATTVDALAEVQQRYTGRKEGRLTAILKQMKDFSDEEKREVGPRANAARIAIEEAIQRREDELQEMQAAQDIDLTLPGIRPQRGTLHIMTQVMDDLLEVFEQLGFMVAEGPELESEYYNFEALNIPESHPARDIQDTFFIKSQIERTGAEERRDYGQDKWVMRTHTSPMQIRMMEEHGAPIRLVIPGRVFRNEATDATHDHTFYQLEGLVVDKGIAIGHLLWFLTEVMKQYYQKDVTVRLRPGYFPFVEPGYEIDLSCVFCDGAGCPVCKKTGWIEMGGSGMVHPSVLRAGGIDPEEYTGFAFGLGISRIPMLKYGIDDIRRIHQNDLSVLKQF
jgi:phenylalanyl-tRNA synthetase alpha chain